MKLARKRRLYECESDEAEACGSRKRNSSVVPGKLLPIFACT